MPITEMKILLVTTKGCEACTIMENIINQALECTSKDVVFEVKDFKNVDRELLNKFRVKDYPTTFFIINDSVVKHHFIGTMPTAVILRWMDIHFK